MKLHFHREISQLNTEIAKLGGLVEDAIGKALVSLREGNHKLAEEVLEGDDYIDQLEVEIEEHCLKILALYQPVARDLRFIISVLKVNNELEHMGDFAQSIAQKITYVPKAAIEKSGMKLLEMGSGTQKMVGMALDALLKEDAERALEVIEMDDHIDQLHIQHHRLVADRLKYANPPLKLPDLGLLSVSRSLERISDKATSIAQDVIYYVEARIIRHQKMRDLKPFSPR
ncbi:phosphate signaling complex protein PhoU [Sulfidibacter corallicola]|uniref:Phosphate-specific transport system accessory protein PhoU n=1 Tax=Sulfidibacter corallicola TaxID=2818388 RepID=A0A8A4TV62_SULCO|nr:phosphate signaling complex protein PhoU [Sulfidibacter corallicola]QTD53247.1 phosphate signaling complex protein PhoU [Sulfidibacter corallicola]